MKWIAHIALCCITLTTLAELPNIRLQPVLRGLERPTSLIHDGTKRLFITEQTGMIRLVVDGKLQSQPYLNIADVIKDGGECGLLSVAFHPKFADNGYFYVNFTAQKPKLRTVIAEFKVDPKATVADSSTGREILSIDQPYSNHNGGQIKFGPDGMLYIGMGDGGAANDPQNHAQNLSSLLGKMLRIDVTPRQGYRIPEDNPDLGSNARKEIWAYGLRNPWRFCFDRETGICYAADVGQYDWEEVDIIVKGGNYGWRPREGFHATPKFSGREILKSPHIDPIAEYDHKKGDISITGGYVYRGKEFPKLAGWYFYADYSSGRLWALKYDGKAVIEQGELL